MTDETINELLSRHLDGDLDIDEKRALEARLEAEPDLKAEFDTMKRLRSSIASLAAAKDVPPELDQLVDPLLRGNPEVVTVRPWLRWLATAAAVIVGATIVIEVNRRDPGPGIESLAKAAKDNRRETTERFALAPLPTSSLPPEQQPLGAADRLLASPVPDVELEDPPPLDVRGPLEVGERGDTLDETSSTASAGVVDEPSTMTVLSDAKKLGREKSDRPLNDIEAPRGQEEMRPGRAAAEADALQPWDEAPPMGRAQLFVFIDGESAWREFTPKDTCRPGRYPVRVVISRGVVREVRPVGGAASATPSQRLCAANLVLDLELDGVIDGQYPAEVVVAPRGAER